MTTPTTPAAPTDWTSASITELIEHLVATHHRATCALLDRLRAIAGSLGEPIAGKVQALAKELIAHQLQEESALFPVCIKLDAASHLQQPPELDATAAIHQMSQGHERWRTTVEDLRGAAAAITGEQPTQARELLACLDELINDLDEHSWKEEEILLPAVLFSQDLVRARRDALRRADGDQAAQRTTADAPHLEGPQP